MNSRSKFDLRLLLVLEAILQEGSVSAAGKRLGISQAAASNALNRLRAALADPLFTRGPRGMEPTARALELSGPIQQSLATLREALARPTFSDHQPAQTFRLAMSDHAVMVVLPQLLRILRKKAPGVRLEIESKWNSRVESQLDAAKIDCALGIIPDLPKRFGRLDLFEDHYICLMRENHPLAGSRMTKEAFSKVGHVSVRPSLDRAQKIDDMLQALGCPRQVVLNVNQFLAVPSILLESDLVAYMLESIAGVLEQARLRIVPVPFAERRTQVVLTWNKARARDPANAWIRQQVVAACKSIRSDSLVRSRA
jgi:DNA-binding transcriptional LysR family regulator